MHFGQRWMGLSGLVATLVLGACSSTPVATPTATEAPAPQAPVAAAQPAAQPVATRAPLAAYLDPSNPLSQKRSVYFDFDQYSVKPSYADLIQLHGKFLAAHPEVAIRVQGNTDEVGGSEYNLALGQKRADAVVKALKLYGVKDSQLEAVSFGKEKPKAQGHDEAARAENRRADLSYPDH